MLKKAVAKACGCNAATLYQYFENLDDLIIQSTAYCMAKVEDEYYLKSRIEVLKMDVSMFTNTYRNNILRED